MILARKKSPTEANFPYACDSLERAYDDHAMTTEPRTEPTLKTTRCDETCVVMYKFRGYYVHMRWTIAKARRHFSQLIHSVADSPQPLYKHNRMVAVVIEARMYREFSEWRARRDTGTMGGAFAELRRLCAEDAREIDTPERRDRPSSFPETLDGFPG